MSDPPVGDDMPTPSPVDVVIAALGVARRALRERFGVSKSTVAVIINNQNWRDDPHV